MLKYQGIVTDALWGQLRALVASGNSVVKVSQLAKCSRSVVYNAINMDTPPSERKRAVKRPDTKAKRARDKRRAAVKMLARKRTTIIARKLVKARGRPRHDGRARAQWYVEKKVIRPAFRSPQAMARELTRTGTPISASTVRRDLESNGFTAVRIPKAPPLRDADKVARVKFAKRMLRETQDEHRQLVFSDEKWFDSNDHGDGYEWVDKTMKRSRRETCQSPPKVYVWGAIGLGFRQLVIMHVGAGGVTSTVYREQCLQKLKRCRGVRGKRLMQDGAKVHWTQENKTYIANEVGMSVLDGWPAHSPDLNPIEHIWSVMARRVSDRGPWGVEDLEKYVAEEWRSLSTALIDKAVLSFRGLCQKCVKRDGGLVD